MDTRNAMEVTKRLMEKVKTCSLSTVSPEGFPETRAMLNLKNKEAYPGLVSFFAEQNDPCVIFFSTNTSSAKVSHLHQNPKACVYYVDPHTFSGVMLQGSMETVNDPDLKQRLWQPGWEMYYPKGPLDPDNTILRMQPISLELYSNMSGCKLRLGVN